MRKKILLAIGLVILLTSSATAAPLIPGTLEDYIALGATGGEIGNLHFEFPGYAGSASGGAVAMPDWGINVIPIFGPNPGLQFSAAWAAGPGQTMASLIMYHVDVLSGGVAHKGRQCQDGESREIR